MRRCRVVPNHTTPGVTGAPAVAVSADSADFHEPLPRLTKKVFTDTYGHQVGDLVLKSIADNVKAALREGDTLMRYGGEEFLSVMPGAGETDLRTVC